MKRSGLVKKHLNPRREFEVSHPQYQGHREPRKNRDGYGRVAVSGRDASQFAANFHESVGMGTEVMGHYFGGEFVPSPEERISVFQRLRRDQPACGIFGRAGNQVEGHQQAEMGQFVSMEMVMAVPHAGYGLLTRICQERLSENGKDIAAALPMVVDPGPARDLIGTKLAQFFPGFLFSGKHELH